MARLAVVAVCLAATGLPTAPSQAASAQATAKKSEQKAPVKKAAVKKKAGKPAIRSVVSRPGGPQYESIVVDADTGRVLHEANADVASPPASLTKMMTLYMLFDALKKGEVRMNTPMKVSAHAASQAPSKIGLVRGKVITVDQAIDAEVTKSANDVAVVIAEHLGGTEERFAQKMTATARAMGMKQTTFHNASGLPDPEQFSSARDMAILAKHLIQDHTDFYPLFSRMEFAYGNQTIRTHNHLLEFYEGADGIKTGYTVASGYNLVTSAKRGQQRLIGVVFGGATASARDRHMADLLDEGFSTLNGKPETLVAAKRIEEFQKINLAAAAQVKPEDVPASAGDRDESSAPPASVAALIQSVDLPPARVSNVEAVPAPKLASLPARNPRPVPTNVASLADGNEPASRPILAAPPPGTWGIQIGAFGTEDKATTTAGAAADSLKSAYPAATAVVEPAVIGGKKLFRAQIHGLDQKDLIKACAMISVQPMSACKALPPAAKLAAG
ncbi:MAG: serine hydrolase [Rhodospirillaceae bacterium]